MPNVVNLINMEGKEILDESLSEFIKLKIIKRNSTVLTKIGKDGISTSTEDGGVGVPTFALLSSALMIETVSEVCLNKILNYYGIFPPYGNNTSICNLGSLWKEDDELIELIKLKYNKNKKLQLNNKSKEEIIQLFLEQDEDNIIQYYSFNNEFIIGVLSLPTWYVNIKKENYLKKNKPIIKSHSISTSIIVNKNIEKCKLKNSNSEIIKNDILSDDIDSKNDIKECNNPEQIVLLEYNSPYLQYHPLSKKKSQESLNDDTVKSSIKDSSNFDKDESRDSSDNNIVSSEKNNEEDDVKSNNQCLLDVTPEQQSNARVKEVFHSEECLNDIKNTSLNNLSINNLIENDELKETFVAYIVRNYYGRYTWISSLKYENNNVLFPNLFNKSRTELIKKNDSMEFSDKSGFMNDEIIDNIPRKFFNSTSNIRFSNEPKNKFSTLSKDNNMIFETGTSKEDITDENEEQVDEYSGNSKEFKILNCTCFNENELPNNNDIINGDNRKSYNKIEKISEILFASEEQILKEQNVNNPDAKKYIYYTEINIFYFKNFFLFYF